MTAKRDDGEAEIVPETPDTSGAGKGRTDLGFERWLGKQLHGLYDPVLDEAVPDDIAKLIDGFVSREADDDGKSDQ